VALVRLAPVLVEERDRVTARHPERVVRAKQPEPAEEFVQDLREVRCLFTDGSRR